MGESPGRKRTVSCALCGREIVIAPQSHFRLAAGQRAHVDCVMMSYRSGYMRPGVHLVKVCSELGCDTPLCSRWTHRKAVLERPEPGAVERVPPFAAAVDEQPDCEICGKPFDDNGPPYTPNYDGRFVHATCVLDQLFRAWTFDGPRLPPRE